MKQTHSPEDKTTKQTNTEASMYLCKSPGRKYRKFYKTEKNKVTAMDEFKFKTTKKRSHKHTKSKTVKQRNLSSIIYYFKLKNASNTD